MKDAQIHNIREIVEPLLASLGLGLWGIEMQTTPRGSLLRIYVEAEGGVTIDQCKTVSKHLSLIFDVDDPLPGSAYTLEVSSPGLERPFFSIEQLRPYLGQKIALKCKQPVQGSKKWRGHVSSIDGNSIELQTENQTLSLDWDQCSRIHLVYDGPVPAGKPKKGG